MKLFKLDKTAFAQPSGATVGTFDLTKVLEISFSPGSLDYNTSPAGTSTVEVQELVVYGKGSLMNVDPVLSTIASVNAKHFVRTGSMLSINGVSGPLNMFSASGRLVRSAGVQGGASVDLSDLSAGTYLVTLGGSGLSLTDRIVIDR